MTYRLYIVSGLSGRFEPALEFDAPNDNAAIVAAELSREGRPAELWQGSRIVKELNSQTEPSVLHPVLQRPSETTVES